MWRSHWLFVSVFMYIYVFVFGFIFVFVSVYIFVLLYLYLYRIMVTDNLLRGGLTKSKHRWCNPQRGWLDLWGKHVDQSHRYHHHQKEEKMLPFLEMVTREKTRVAVKRFWMVTTGFSDEASLELWRRRRGLPQELPVDNLFLLLLILLLLLHLWHSLPEELPLESLTSLWSTFQVCLSEQPLLCVTYFWVDSTRM